MRARRALRAAARACALAAAGVLAAGAVSAAPADPADLSMVVVGHVRGNATGEQQPLLPELVAEIAALEPDVVVLTGDMIWGDYFLPRANPERIRADWEALDAALAPIGAPVYRVPGNHDLNDPVTRDIYLERYGPLPRAVEVEGCLLLLLHSAWSPQGDGPAPSPRPAVRGVDLDAGQLAFLRDTLADAGSYRHVFAFLHHLLWWEEDAAWWRDVHPLLARAGVRAVFAGEYGPLKFSHLRRDGVDYVQSAIEGAIPIELLRALDSSRLLYYQLDNYLHVTALEGSAKIEVRTIGALSSGKFTPEIYQRVHEEAPRTLLDDVRDALGGRVRRTALALLALASLAAGVLLGRALPRGRG